MVVAVLVLDLHVGELHQGTPAWRSMVTLIESLRREPAYGALVFRIWGDLRDEVDRARRQEAEVEA